MPAKKIIPKKKKKSDAPLESPTLPSFAMTDRERSARRLMWFGVIGFSLIIFALWGWSVTVQISGFQWNKAPEATLASKTKQEWNDIFAKQKEQAADRETALEQIKNALAQLNANNSANNSVSSSITTTTK